MKRNGVFNRNHRSLNQLGKDMCQERSLIDYSNEENHVTSPPFKGLARIGRRAGETG